VQSVQPVSSQNCSQLQRYREQRTRQICALVAISTKSRWRARLQARLNHLVVHLLYRRSSAWRQRAFSKLLPTFPACGVAVPTVVPDMVASALPTSASFAPLGTVVVDAVPSGSPSTQTVGNVDGNHHVPAVNLTQDELQAACKRIHVSSSGDKAVLVNRLATKGFKYLQQVRQLAIEFEEQGRSKDVLHLTIVAEIRKLAMFRILPPCADTC
jgi:SAP domain